MCAFACGDAYQQRTIEQDDKNGIVAIYGAEACGPPVVNSLNPSTVETCGLTAVTASGSNLLNVNDVQVGGSSVSFQKVSDSTITFTSPFKTNLNADVVAFIAPGGTDNNQSLSYTPPTIVDIRGTTFIVKPGGGQWIHCGPVQANGVGTIYVVFLGDGTGSTPLGNGISVPVTNAQLFTMLQLNNAGTGQTIISSINGPNLSGLYRFGVACFDLLQGKWVGADPNPLNLTIF